MRAALALLTAAVVVASCGGGDERLRESPRPLRLALDFTPNAAHAGVYAAAREGHDRAAGIELEVLAPASSTDSLKLLASGRADVAIVDIHDLGIARERGEDVVGVGAIVQRPLAAVIASREVRRPRELEGRRVGLPGLPSDEAVLRAVVANDGGDPERVRRLTIGFSAVPSLVSGRVDAVVAFWNAEGVALRERGVRTREFRVDRFGAPGYPELVLAARGETVAGDAELIEGALRAVEAGTRAALARPEPAIAEIAERSGADEHLVRAELAAVGPALEPPVRLDRDALERWADFDARFGILRERPDVDRAFALELAP